MRYATINQFAAGRSLFFGSSNLSQSHGRRGPAAILKGHDMGMDLLGKKCSTMCSASYWTEALDVAVKYGWKSKHSLDFYAYNDWHRVTNREAMTLAQALEKSGEPRFQRIAQFCRSSGGFQIG